jgi:hypothetical protein
VTKVQSAIFSLPSDGSYSIRVLLGGSTGVFETLAGVSSFSVSSNFAFVEEARLAWYHPNTPEPTLIVTATAPSSSPSSTASFTVPLLVFLHSRRMTFCELFVFVFVSLN